MTSKNSDYIHGTSASEQARLSALNTLTNQDFIKFLDLKPNAHVLEVGSGLGILASQVAQKVPLGKVVGLELSVEQLAVANKIKMSNLEFQQGDGHAISFKDKTFDVAYCRYLLEHVGEPKRVLGEIRRILKPNGRAFFQENNILVTEFDPDCPQFTSLWKKFCVLQSKMGGDALIGKKLFGLLKSAGFQNVTLSIQPEVHFYGSPGFAPWIDNLIGNIDGARENLVKYGIASPSEVDGAIEELKGFKNQTQASAFFYWNRAQASIPH